MPFKFVERSSHPLVCVFALILACWADPVQADTILYSNDFDGSVYVDPGVMVSISGGDQTTGTESGGIVDGQGYDGVTDFGGDMWRVTTADDVLEFTLNGTPVDHTGSVEFSLAIIDSWDGTFGAPIGPDQLVIEILDGSTQQVLWQQFIFGGAVPSSNVASTLVLNQQLGFNASTGDTWWWDDGYRIRFEDIPMTAGSMTFRIHATGSGFGGGTDESFGIDNLMIRAVPEPSSTLVGFALCCLVPARRRRVP
jgi:hypothetical protein